MKLLDYGLIADAKQLEEVSQTALKASAEQESSGHKKTQQACIEAIDNHIKSVLQGLNKKEARNKSVVKSVTDFRHSIVKDFLRTYMVNKRRSCPYCRAPSRDVRCEYNSRIFLKPLSNREAKKWAATRIVQGEEQRATVKQEKAMELDVDGVTETENQQESQNTGLGFSGRFSSISTLIF